MIGIGKTKIHAPILIVLSMCLALLVVGYSLKKYQEHRTKQLYDAIEKGDQQEVEELLNAGAPVNAAAPGSGWKVTYSPLLYDVIFKNDVAIAKILVKHGANVNAKNNNEVTPLHAAAATGHKEMVEFLLENGADLSIRDGTGNTPLESAQENLIRYENRGEKVNPELKKTIEILEQSKK